MKPSENKGFRQGPKTLGFRQGKGKKKSFRQKAFKKYQVWSEKKDWADWKKPQKHWGSWKKPRKGKGKKKGRGKGDKGEKEKEKKEEEKECNL